MAKEKAVATRRAPARRAKKPVIVNNDEDEDDIDLQSSGSDFEEELHKKPSGSSRKRKSVGATVESSDEDEENSSRAARKPRKFISRKSATPDHNSNSKRKGLSARKSNTPTVPSTNGTTTKKDDIDPPKASFLSLSESSESDNDDKAVAKAEPKLKQPEQLKSAKAKSSAEAKKADFSQELVFTQLQALARDHEDEDDHQPWARTTTSSQSSPVKRKDLHLEASELMALVEEPLSEEESDSAADEPEAPEIKAEHASTSSAAIEVTVPLFDQHKKKKNLTEVDIAAKLKRQFDRVRRQQRVDLHKAHVVCLVAHLRHANAALSQPLVLGAALSVVPQAHAVSNKNLTATKLGQFLSWFKEAFRNKSKSQLARKDDFPAPLGCHLLKMLERFSAATNEDLVLLFVALARSVGWEARLVLNVAASPLKPEKDNGTKSAAKAEKSSTTNKRKSTSNVEEKAIKIEKSEVSGKAEAKPKSTKSDQRASKKNTTEESNKGSKSKNTGQKGKNSTDKDKGKSISRSSSANKSKTSEEEQPGSNNSRNDVKSSSKNTGKEDRRSSKSSKSKADGETLPKSRRNEAKEDVSSRRSSSRTSTKSKKSYYHKSSSSEDEQESSPQKSVKKSGKEDPKSPVKLSSKALKEAEQRSAKRARSTSAAARKKKKRAGSESNSSGDEFEVPAMAAVKTEPAKNARKSSTSSSTCPVDYWAEVYVEKGWVCVDVVNGRVGCHGTMEERASKPMLYVLAADRSGFVKDVTRRYAKDYAVRVRKARVDQKWLSETLSPFANPRPDERDLREEDQLNKMLEAGPMPSTVSAFKDHPLYALQRHLLKFEAIYPESAPTLGFLKGEPVYARECVHQLHCRVTWMKEGRIVKLNEQPYKVVKARPKWDRMSQSVVKDQPLDLFGRWQTEEYVPPPAKDGKVPRNEYGNVELFKPWMLPKGTVHIPIQGLNRVAKKLDIDCAPAMIGWDYHCGGCHPIYDGFVVCQEFSETLIDAWNADQQEKKRRDEEKREKRILDNWKKLVRGLLIGRKIREKYADEK